MQHGRGAARGLLSLNNRHDGKQMSSGKRLWQVSHIFWGSGGVVLAARWPQVLPCETCHIANESLEDAAKGWLDRSNRFKARKYYIIMAELGTRLSMSGIIAF
jgi:hypothetical protein